MQLPQFKAHEEAEGRHWWFLARVSILLALLKELVPTGKDTLVLDVGCGTGGNAAALTPHYRVIGIDPIAEAIESAKERFPDAEFLCGYAPEDIPEQMREADVVLLMDVLEHIEDDFLFTSKLLSAMKPGAHLVLMAPADPNLWGAHDKGFEHYRRYTLERLRLLWADLPVETCMASYANSHLYPLVKLARIFSRKRGKALGKHDTDISMPPAPINMFLYGILSGERKRLLRLLRHKCKRGYRNGVSVLAVLTRGEGEFAPRPRPNSVPADKRPWMDLRTT
jgi:SAM-dependent methyltransferase